MTSRKKSLEVGVYPMKAAAFNQFADADVLSLVELPDPIPGVDEVVVQMKAIGLNFADIYRRRGE